jgi:hypothetical protein
MFSTKNSYFLIQRCNENTVDSFFSGIARALRPML